MENRRIAAQMVLRDLENTKRACDARGFAVIDPDTTPLPDGDGDKTLISLTIGSRLDLSKGAVKAGVRMFRQVRQRYPKALIYINLLGFDEDPREVWQIPLARKFFRRWANALEITDPEIAEQQGLDPTSIGTLVACGVFGDEMRTAAMQMLPLKPTTN